MSATAREPSDRLPSFAVGIDVGGTFTDAVAVDSDGRVVSAKTPSTPHDYGEGVHRAIEQLADVLGTTDRDLLGRTAFLAHGTTSSLNALVQRKVGKVGLITTAGHGDSLFIMNVEGRYLGLSSHEIQDILRRRKPEPLLPRTLVWEVDERVDAQGRVLVPLNEDHVRAAVAALVAQGVTAIAVSLLWSFRNPAHEQRIRDIVREAAPQLYVTLSSELTPRIREFARTSTTVMNAQIGPRLRDYLEPLSAELRRRGLNGPLLVMQSSGGTVTAAEAPQAAITTVGSVLSGGVVGAQRLARQLGHKNVVATDVGGTTFLAGLIVDGAPVRASTTIINQHPVNVPTLRVNAIGSGGGAIAWLDDGGNLRVGPRSAEAWPGPACYGLGGELPTNTDANLVLGILSPRGLLDGRRPLSLDRARTALRTIGDPLGLTPEEAAAAVYAIQNAQTGDLLRKIVVEAGQDPRDFAVYAFGGAGPAHCVEYSRELGVGEVIVPLGPVASAFSAYGLCASDVSVTSELSDPSVFPCPVARVRENFVALEEQVRQKLDAQGLELASVRFEREIDLRYSMQMTELATPVPPGRLTDADVEAVVDRFERLYSDRNGPGSGFREAGFQAVTYRVTATARLPFDVRLPEVAPATGAVEDALLEIRRVNLDARVGFEDTPIYDYRRLGNGHTVVGPAVVQVPTTAVVVPGGTRGLVDRLGNLVITYD